MRIPNVYPVHDLRNILKNYGIYWDASRGKGGHGVFKGKDRNGYYRLFPLPSSQHKSEVTRTYIKALLRRFGLDESIFNE